MAVSAPSAAQQGPGDLLAWEDPLHAAASTVFVKAAAGDTESAKAAAHAAASSDALSVRVTACEGNRTAGSTWDTTIAGSVTANRSVRNVRVKGYIEPGRRQIGPRSSRRPLFLEEGTQWNTLLTGDTGTAVLRISAPMEREVERAARFPPRA